ncbi:MAG: porin [Rhodobacter sp. CACIA14H1]|nr:MAG: porin [Rhodobacter sp. CACIA14H1]
MKKILLATTMLVAGASIAAAEVTLSGSARMGVISNYSDNVAANGDESDLTFTSRARVVFNLSGESDSGLSFGASFRADNAVGANAGDAGSVFVSGAFGKLSMGDVDGAAQMATGHVAGVGLTGLGDLNESVFLGAGDGATDPTALYEYAAGDFTVYLSATNPVTTLGVAGPPATRTSDLTAVAIGGKYTFGDYTVGLGYENLSGFEAAATGAVAIGADNTDVDHVVLKVSANVAGFAVQGLIGQADGTWRGVAVDADQYAASVSYTTGALTGTVFYTDDSGLAALGGTTAYGIGASYDLGGGASVVGGVVENKDANAGAGATAFDLGLNFSF